MDRLAGVKWTRSWAACRLLTNRPKIYGGCGPRLNEARDPAEWLGKDNGPANKLADEKEQGKTVCLRGNRQALGTIG